MAELWMPGAERRPEGNGGSMAGGPPRAVWHITWDKLGPGGKMPSFDAIAGYLQSVNYAPHLMWDPWSGRIVQFYPADQSARALANQAGGVETNRMGSRCIQVEVWFSPGAVVGGKKYATVANTPCVGLDRIVAWMRSHGIPDRWPLGWPTWDRNSRSSSAWTSQAGHYGHCHVPENDHTDPGPMPAGMFSTPEEDDLASPETIKAIAVATASEVTKRGINKRGRTVGQCLQTADDGVPDLQQKVEALVAEQAAQGAKLDAILAALAPKAGA